VTATAKPVLVLGLPRSGTTWMAQVLALAPGAVAVMEPDNEKTSAAAVRAKRGLGRFPVLAPTDTAEEYRRLWSWAFAGAPVGTGLRMGDRLLRSAPESQREAAAAGHAPLRLRLAGSLAGLGTGTRPGPDTDDPITVGRRLIVKSVHAPLAAEWLADSFDLDVLVVLRHPANVLASWIGLDLPDRDRALDTRAAVQAGYVERWGLPVPGAAPLERVVWQLGLLTAALEEAAERHPQWHVRVHETMCVDPPAEFRRLYGDLGLEWTDAVDAELEAGDRPGAGFALQRRASEAADAWRTRLGEQELATLRRVLAPFPLRHWSATDMPGDVCAE
jgi:hypothetical protein